MSLTAGWNKRLFDMAAHASGFFALSGVLACTMPAPSTAQSPGEQGYDDARLQALVHNGLKFMTPGPCKRAMMLGVLDDAASGETLDELLTKAANPNADATCTEVVAAARIVRLGRLGELDLAAELEHPSAVVRAVAIRYALGTQTPELASALVKAALQDDEADVRIVAYRAAAALADESMVAALEAGTPADDVETFWRCTALSRVHPTTACPEPSAARGVLEPGDAEPVDRCAVATNDLSGEHRRDALWFFTSIAFADRVRPLDRIEAIRRNAAPCFLPEDVEDEILSSPKAAVEDQALAAAALLWRRHEPVGLPREKRVELRDMATNDMLRECTSDAQCPNDLACHKAPGRGRKATGICAGSNKRTTPRRATIYTTVGSNACWSFMDCPAFYSCYYPDPSGPYGICMY